MRLKKLKLAGFKSFVDPTTLVLPSEIVGIVGPNGCGKSNTIDAVRWVMGESSAKQLRGESMADVIFSGCDTRKPLGQASVELVFDNPDGAAGGEYAKYSEIALRRVVTRDGQSQYFLNNTRCRRKDITDIFLGTGLGKGSYAIIGQGTISRLIEAKPEELRTFLEEAAQISRYKERRRETETRMKNTRENLSRVDDIREELGKQLERLHRQAQAAEKYKTFKDEERRFQAELAAMQWRLHQQKWQDKQGLINQQKVKLEQFASDKTQASAQVEALREKHHDTQDAFNESQSQFYAIGATIARLEEALSHKKERESQLNQDITQASADLQTVTQLIEQDQTQKNSLAVALDELTPELEALSELREQADVLLEESDARLKEWQLQWDAFTETASNANRQADVEQAKLQQIEQRNKDIDVRVQQLDAQQQQIDTQIIHDRINDYSEQTHTLEAQQEQSESQVHELQERLSHTRSLIDDTQQTLDDTVQAVQQQQGRRASLEALQQAALGNDDATVAQWLNVQGLADFPRLAQAINVMPGFETAVETVLGDCLQAVCVDDFTATLSALNELPNASLSLVAAASTADAQPVAHAGLTPLADTITAGLELIGDALGSVFICDSLSDARDKLNVLAANESIITREGIWLSKHWLRIPKSTGDNGSVLARENELQQLIVALEESQAKSETAREIVQQQKAQLADIEMTLNEARAQSQSLTSQTSDAKAKLRIAESQLESATQRQREMLDEMAKLQTQKTQMDTQYNDARLQWQEAMGLMETHSLQRETLQSQRETIQAQLQDARSQAHERRERWHELTLATQSKSSALNNLEHNLKRLSERRISCDNRLSGLKQAIAAANQPGENYAEQLEEALAKRLDAETIVGERRSAMQDVETAWQQAEHAMQEAAEYIHQVEASITQLQIDSQTYKVQAQTLERSLTEQEHNLEQLIANLAEDASIDAWKENIDSLGRRISRLGAINLAAIEEYKTESERKNYLDTQAEDLISALTTLENAINKMDKETRQRFKETFDEVNESFKKIFPRLFGGGRAELQMTGDDLLDTGLTVMAQPPGKRNSSIHLLSGGEKALTAVALVFAIFQLNPSPFCMLDEVDAPLDDANVGRFCNLVKEMSKNTQFIVITHNKVTMEMAHQLCGVTMHEPGVSRLVSVDIAEAAAFAEI